jgi:hypothetical protein
VVARVLIGVALVAVALAVAAGLERRRARTNTPVRDAYPVPRQLHRPDFAHPDAPWLVALFSSATCDSCPGVRALVLGIDAPGVAVCDVEFPAARELHERYAISGVPMVLIADAEGVVRESFVGPMRAEELTGALARVASV